MFQLPVRCSVQPDQVGAGQVNPLKRNQYGQQVLGTEHKTYFCWAALTARVSE